MVVLRRFRRSGELLVDVYGRNAAQKAVSFQAPVAALERLRWEAASVAPPERPSGEALEAQRLALRQRLRALSANDLTPLDFRDVRRLGDAKSVLILQERLPELVIKWSSSDVAFLADAAAAILAVDSTHGESARLLTSALLSEDQTVYVRTQIAGCISDALRLDRETEAMFELRDALAAVARGQNPIAWGPFVYSCVRHLAKFERLETLRRCEEDLRERDEWDRGMLLNELAEVPGADVMTLVRRQLGAEESPRLRVRMMRMLGDLVPDRSRAEILRRALGDASPSCRFLAIKALARLPPQAALDLAKRSLRGEPDEHLRRLLAEAIKITKARAGTKTRRTVRKGGQRAV